MRKLLFCALVVVCAAPAANAQDGSGYAFRTASPQWQSTSAFGSANGASWGPQGYMPQGYMPQGYMPQGYTPQGYMPQGYMPQASMPYNPAGNYYPVAAYPAYPMPMAPDGTSGMPANVSAMPMMPAMTDDAAAGLAPLPGVPFEDPAGLAPGMPLPKSALAADNDSDNHDADESFHRPCNERVWASFDYTMAWFRPQRVATPLATTGSPVDPHPGALGQPGTVVLFGNEHADPGMFSGIRGEVGVFLDDCDHFSLEGVGLYLFPNHATFSQTSDAMGNPVLARPVFNVVAMREAGFVDALPGAAAGGFHIDARSEFAGAEFNAGCHIYAEKRLHAEALVGFRYMHLDEGLTIMDQFQPLVNNTFTFLGAPVNSGSSLSDLDSFRTTNDFYGMQLGGKVEWEGDWYTFGCFAKIALGANDEVANINGSTTLFSPGGNQTAVGGLLALPTNIGHHAQTTLAYAPEGGINVAVKVAPCVQLVAGYSFLFWDAVARPGSQINPLVNPGRVPTDTSFGTVSGPGQPTFSFHEDSFYLHQINVGVQIRY